jgi:uncharacterized protein YodC (DUF2158 family)
MNAVAHLNQEAIRSVRERSGVALDIRSSTVMKYMQIKFRVGSKVRLNSGSPDLTVLTSNKQTTVEWFNGEFVERCTLPSVCFVAV